MGLFARAAILASILLAARVAFADDGLGLTVALSVAPADPRSATYDVTVRNGAATPLVLAPWQQSTWQLMLVDPKGQGHACEKPSLSEPSKPLVLAPGGQHVFHFHCSGGMPALLVPGCYRVQANYGSTTEPSWLLTQDRTHYFQGGAQASAELIIPGATPAAVSEPAITTIPLQIDRGGCSLSLAEVKLSRQYVRSGRERRPNEPPPKQDSLSAVLRVRGGTKACRFAEWQLELVDAQGQKHPYAAAAGITNTGRWETWDGEVSAHANVDIALGTSGFFNLDSKDGEALTLVLSLSDVSGQFWIRSEPVALTVFHPAVNGGPAPP